MSLRVLNMVDLEAAPDVLAPLEQIAEVVSLPARQELLRDEIPKFDAYLASLQVQVNREVLERARRLRVIATASTGLDHIELGLAKSRGIEVLSLKHDRAFLDQITATAEMAWALLLATVRRLPWSFQTVQRGHWGREQFRGRQ